MRIYVCVCVCIYEREKERKEKQEEKGKLTFQNLPHRRVVDLPKPQPRQYLPVYPHKPLQRLARLLLLELPLQPRRRQLRAEFRPPLLRLLRVVRGVVALRGAEEDPLLEVHLEDLTPYGK